MTLSLWDFSVATYSRPGVQQACLSLQDRMGVDVNILMYCCWHGALTRDGLSTLLADLAPWQNNIVSGLRSVRRKLKLMLNDLAEFSENADDLLFRIAALELEAEKLQQAMLERHGTDLAAGSASPQTAADNLSYYFACLNKTTDASAQKALDILISAAFTISNAQKQAD
jgi:uncharacterized protein (TIGR02444 family)